MPKQNGRNDRVPDVTDALAYARPAARAALMDLFEHGFCIRKTHGFDADWVQHVLHHDHTPLTDEELLAVFDISGRIATTWAEAAWDHWPHRVHCEYDAPSYYPDPLVRPT
jgi:hypothetical protein